MNHENTEHVPSEIIPHPAANTRLENVAFYTLLATIILAPLVFMSSSIASIDLISVFKTTVIVLGTLVSAILYALVSMRSHRLILPPKSILLTSVIIIISLILSSIFGTHPLKSFFGQGFEIYTTSFTTILFLLAFVSYTAIKRRPDRAFTLYGGMAVSFGVVFIFHSLRFVFGSDFLSLGVFSSPLSTFAGNWNELPVYSIAVLILVVMGMVFLPLSKKVRSLYVVVGVAAFILAFLAYSQGAWIVASLVFLGFTSYLFVKAKRRTKAFKIRNIPWPLLVVGIISIILSLWGPSLKSSITSRLKINSQETTLPWQLTVDVAAGALKDHPLFGVGPNRFVQAYISYKPIIVNSGNGWNIEFSSGFGFIPTFIVNQGIFGAIAWLLFFIFLGICGIKTLAKSLVQSNANSKFIAFSSFGLVSFLWSMDFILTPTLGLVAYTFIATGILVATAVNLGALPHNRITPTEGSRLIKILLSICIVLGVAWGLVYIKKIIAFSYFDSGIQEVTTLNDPDAASVSFSKALAYDTTDLYMISIVEADIARVNKLASTITSASSASTTQVAASKAQAIITEAGVFADRAIAYDKMHYYNYLSKARVQETALSLGVTSSYDGAVAAYNNAIKVNPLNPSIYLNLARIQARANKLDDAIATLGSALQVKNNYLDAIFMLSQAYAAKGNLKDAITAATVATEINPQQPIFFFQLGLLQYNNHDYGAAATALEKAVALQKDYANAQYFLGLSYSRLGKNNEAIEQFKQLAQSNPDNQEVATIYDNLRSGKSPFQDAKAPVTPPEKRPTLPIKSKKK